MLTIFFKEFLKKQFLKSLNDVNTASCQGKCLSLTSCTNNN